jgi:histidyl-tRNA synthetase
MTSADLTSLVRPQTLRGFRDILSAEMIVRNDVIGKIRHVYESYGYVPMDTPVLELLPTLVGTGGEDTDKLIFTLQSPEKQQVGLRFDLTVPFARVIAQYHPAEIKLPFRRYHIGPVFRADDPQPEQGRFRQFTQFDIDIAGTATVAADAEIIAAMSDAFRAIGLLYDCPPGDPRRYVIRVNNRRLVDAFLLGIDIDDPVVAKHILRVIDKRDKLTDNELIAELGAGRTDASGDQIRGVGLAAETIRSIFEFISIAGSKRAEVLASLDKAIRPGREKDEALSEVQLLCEHLDALGVPEEAAQLDPSLTRGLDYYTNTVFEGALPQAGVGSVMGGGRYNDLVNRFLDEPIPATGASIGLDRLVTGLRNIGLFAGEQQSTVEVLVLVMPGVPEPESSRVAAELRAHGIGAELYVGEATGKVKRQLAFANARGMSVAVLLGAGELAQGAVSIKDLRTGSEAREGIADREEYRSAGTVGQKTVPRTELVDTVRQVLALGN